MGKYQKVREGGVERDASRARGIRRASRVDGNVGARAPGGSSSALGLAWTRAPPAAAPHQWQRYHPRSRTQSRPSSRFSPARYTRSVYQSPIGWRPSDPDSGSETLGLKYHTSMRNLLTCITIILVYIYLSVVYILIIRPSNYCVPSPPRARGFSRSHKLSAHFSKNTLLNPY